MKYQCLIEEVIQTKVVIEAKNEQEAMAKIKDIVNQDFEYWKVKKADFIMPFTRVEIIGLDKNWKRVRDKKGKLVPYGKSILPPLKTPRKK